MKFQHVVSRVPNNWFFHLLIECFKKQMKKSNSIWSVRLRYRVPRNGYGYNWNGELKREEAKTFSVYMYKRV